MFKRILLIQLVVLASTYAASTYPNIPVASEVPDSCPEPKKRDYSSQRKRVRKSPPLKRKEQPTTTAQSHDQMASCIERLASILGTIHGEIPTQLVNAQRKGQTMRHSSQHNGFNKSKPQRFRYKHKGHRSTESSGKSS